jgi:hypothetical protein
MTTSFHLTSNNLQFTFVASFAENIDFSKATGFCPQLISDNCEMQNATKRSV